MILRLIALLLVLLAAAPALAQTVIVTPDGKTVICTRVGNMIVCQ